MTDSPLMTPTEKAVLKVVADRTALGLARSSDDEDAKEQNEQEGRR